MSQDVFVEDAAIKDLIAEGPSPALEAIRHIVREETARAGSPLMTIEELMAITGMTERASRAWRERHGVPIVPGYTGCVSRAQVMPILRRAASVRNLPKRAKRRAL